MFATESSMQSWMKGVIESLGSLKEIILPIDHFSTRSRKEEIIFESYQNAIDSLIDPEILSENQNISKKSGHVLRPDFVLISRNSGCLFVVELKNNVSATRQTGTEIGAYSASIQEAYPNIAGGNIITIIVSTEWPTILLTSALCQIIYERNCCLFLRPIIVENQIKLKPISPSDLLYQQYNFENLPYISGYHLDATPKWLYNIGFNSKIQYTERYRNMMYSVQMEGRKQKSHGFAFLWHRGDETQGATVSYAILSQNFSRKLKTPKFNNPFDNYTYCDDINLYLANDHIVKSFSRSIGDDFAMDNWIGFDCWSGFEEEIFRSDAVLVSFCCWGILEDEMTKLLRDQMSKDHTPAHDNPALGLQLITKFFGKAED